MKTTVPTLAAIAVAFCCASVSAQEAPSTPEEPTYDPYSPPPADAWDEPEEPTPAAPAAGAEAELEPAEAVRAGPLSKGTFLFSADTLMSLTFTKNELYEGGSRSGSTFLFRMVPRLGYVVHENVEVALGAGVLTRQLFRDGGETATEVDGVLEVTGRYHVLLDQRLSVFAELSVGGYSGSSEQQIQVEDGKKIDASTDTLGITLGAGAGAGWAVDENFSLRAGLGLLGLLGQESVATEGGSLSAATFHVGLVIAGAYRF